MEEQDDVRAAEEELQALALEGLNSGEPIRADARFWEEKHRDLQERLDRTSATRKLIEQAKVPAELVFQFFATFSRFEYALKLAGFLEQKDYASADWTAFGETLAKMPADVQEQILKCSSYLQAHPPKKQVRSDAGKLTWKVRTPPVGESQIETVMFSVKTVRNNLFHGGKFPMQPIKEPGRDQRLIQECLDVLNTLLAIKHPPCLEVAECFQMDV